MTVPPVDFAPTLRLLLLALVVALLPLSWWWLQQRGSDLRARAAALTALTLFLTFDLVVFGSLTRLTDSGLGCPDWPGCYGHMSPLGAASAIREAEAALPSGPVTFTKAWIEMLHRYLAMTVGVLILVMAASAWFERRRGTLLPVSPWWPTATLVWVVIQGLFGKYTVTLKLYPAVVTLHLLGGLLLLVLLAAQHAAYKPRPLALPAPLTRWLALAALLLAVQIALGGWVSTNYAVLACSEVPTCNGAWWPKMDFAAGFSVLRPLGRAAGGGFLPFDALVAIHMAHRLFALLAVAALAALAVGLRRVDAPAARRFSLAIGGVTVLQVLTGLSNIVLDWPLAAALMHSAGAAALVLLFSLLWSRARQARGLGATVGDAPDAGHVDRGEHGKSPVAAA
jgi:cytochrome c oxidase assembly protein subunit 15